VSPHSTGLLLYLVLLGARTFWREFTREWRRWHALREWQARVPARALRFITPHLKAR